MRAVAVVAVLVALTGCAGSTEARPAAPSTTAPTQIARLVEAAALAPCPSSAAAPARGDGLPDLKLGCLGDGPAVTLSGLRGTPLVVNVWASWCPPCAEEMPYLNAVHRAAGDGVRFLGIDLLDRREQGLAWAADLKMTFPSVEDPDGVIRSRLRIPAPPATLFVRPDGGIAKIHYGAYKSEQQLRDALREHLGVRL